MICGIDEAGRGPVMGPLVIAAVAVEDDSCLRSLHVKDSKLLTKKKRDEIAPLIKECSIVETIILTAEEIDNCRITQSLNDIEADCFASLINKIKPDFAYADAADVIADRFTETIMKNVTCDVNLTSKHKADTLYPIVSAASIIAKTTRDSIIEEISSEFNEPIGSGYPGDMVTRTFIENWIGKNGSFPPHTRTSWKTAKEIYSKTKITKITDWE